MKSWQDRIADAGLEKTTTEDAEFGADVTTSLLVKFFVSDSVIPNKCKTYHNGFVKSYNFEGIDVTDLIVKEVFRIKHSEDLVDIGKVNIIDIKDRMHALWLILEHKYDAHTGIARSIYMHSLLGAISSLFTALDGHPHYADVLNFQYRKTFRKFAFHFKYVILKQGIESLTILATHFYEHCQKELSTIQKFPSLSQSNRNDDCFSPRFKSWLIRCLDSHSCLHEYNERLMQLLSEDKALLYP